MVLDEDLSSRDDDDPAFWAPIHAFEILSVLGPLEAAEPLLACFDWDEDWLFDALPDLYASPSGRRLCRCCGIIYSMPRTMPTRDRLRPMP